MKEQTDVSWVPVSEGLPREGAQVLVTVYSPYHPPSGHAYKTHIGTFYTRDIEWPMSTDKPRFYLSYRFYWLADDASFKVITTPRVIAWAELPSPYEGPL